MLSIIKASCNDISEYAIKVWQIMNSGSNYIYTPAMVVYSAYNKDVTLVNVLNLARYLPVTSLYGYQLKCMSVSFPFRF